MITRSAASVDLAAVDTGRAFNLNAVSDGEGGFEILIGASGQQGQAMGLIYRFDGNAAQQGSLTLDMDVAADEAYIATILALSDGGYYAVANTFTNDIFRTFGDVIGQRFSEDGTGGMRVSLADADARLPYDYSTSGATLLPNGEIAISITEQELAFGPNSGGNSTVTNQLLQIHSLDGALQNESLLSQHVHNPFTGGLFYELGTSGGGDVVVISDRFGDMPLVHLRDDNTARLTNDTSLAPQTNGQYPNERQVTALEGGGSVITWSEESSGVAGSGVIARVFDAEGLPIGDEIRMNSAATDWQDDYAVTSLPEGGFLVSWLDYNGILRRVFDPEPAVLAQAFSYDGTRLGDIQRLIEWPEPESLGYDRGPMPVDMVVLGEDRLVLLTELDTSGPLTAHLFDMDLPSYLRGTAASEFLEGSVATELIRAGDGADTIAAGAGDDTVEGGDSDLDLSDVIYGGEGNDSIDGGYGNDELRGDAGNDTITGGFGGDTVIGGIGDDVLTGSALGDVLFGGDGEDFINGGFGYDRVNGGSGADEFYHLGIFDHGSDWIQDYGAAEGDVLVFGNADATRAQFQINTAATPNAGLNDVEEAFVVYRPTGQIIWALIDGAGQDEINLRIGGDVFDLMA